MYKNNSGLIAKTKESNYKKGLCLTEKISVYKSATILILDRYLQFEKWTFLNRLGKYLKKRF